MVAGTSSSKHELLREDVTKAMKGVGLSLSNDLLTRCVNLAGNFRLTGATMAELWEAHSLNKNVDDLNETTFTGYRHFLAEELKPKTSVKRTVSSPSAVVSPPPPTTSNKRINLGKNLFHDRSNVGQVVATYNPHQLDEWKKKDDDVGETSIEVVSGLMEPVRFMNTPIEKIAQVLEDQLQDMQSQMPLIDNRVAVGIPSPEPITCIGRICNEAHQGKLNSTSLLLEGDRDSANGARINLELTPPYSVFPGQIVALEGTNLTGRKLQATKIVSDGIPPPSNSSSGDTSATKMVVVAGPYTISDNLEYEPFLDFVHSVLEEEQPPIVVLMGPFLPTDQAFELVTKEGVSVPVTKETLFAEKIAYHLENYVTEHALANTQFILVPSVNDALGRPVYPQPPLQDKDKKHLPENLRDGLGLQFIDTAASKKQVVHCVPNPCTLCINDDIMVGMTSTDVLHHMSMAEIHAGMEMGTRLPRLAKHLIQQQSYYPLFPSTHINIDYAQMEHWRMPSAAPDILLLPSKLSPFCKPVTTNTISINPGCLTRGRAGGTYGIIHVSSGSKKPITDRIRVDIKRI